jgi:DNA replication protein DnaC
VRNITFESSELVHLVGADAVAGAQQLDRRFVTFHGRPGAGKTALAACKWTEAIRQVDPKGFHYDISAHYVSAITLARDETDLEPSRSARKADILLLDDVGLERSTPFGIETIRDVVFARHAAGSLTYTTTHLTKAEASARYGEGFARRLFESAIHLGPAEG